MLPKGGKKVLQTIKSVRPGSDTGAKSKQYFQNKASTARFKAATTDLKATTRKLNVAMDKAGTAMEKKIKWYQKAANKKRYSDDFYKGRTTKHYYKD
jgi:hypothetical protein